MDLIKISNGRVVNVSSRAGEHWVKEKDECQQVILNDGVNSGGIERSGGVNSGSGGVERSGGDNIHYSKLSGFASFTLDTVQGDCKEIPTDRLYGRSKFANMVFTRRLEKELRRKDDDDGCTTLASAFSLHPGVIRTQLWRHLNPLYFTLVAPFWWYITKNAYQGAQTSIYLCIAPLNQLKGGNYYSDCKLDDASENQLALDEELQERLWNTSLELCQPFLNQD